MKTIRIFLSYTVLATTIIFGFQHCDLWTPEVKDVPCPSLVDIIPDGAHFNDTVTLTGSGFLMDCPELYNVSINGEEIPKANILSVPDQGKLLFKVPQGAKSGYISISVTNNPGCKTSTNKPFTYYYTATKVGLLAGSPSQDNCPNSGTDNYFNSPSGLDFDEKTGNLIVADKFHNLIRIIKPPVNPGSQGSITASLGKISPNCSPDCEDGTVFQSTNAHFRFPTDVEVDQDGSIYVMEESSNAVIRQIRPDGSVIVFAGKCQEPKLMDGLRRPDARLELPLSIAIDNKEFYFTDAGNIRKISSSDVVGPFFTKPANSFFRGIEVNHSRQEGGPIFVADEKGAIRFFDENRTPGEVLIRNKNSLNFSRPVALTIDSSGVIFVADKDAHRIFALYNNGELVSLAGTGSEGYVDNLPGEKAQFKYPSGITMDQDKRVLYISDGGNHVIRYIVLE